MTKAIMKKQNNFLYVGLPIIALVITILMNTFLYFGHNVSEMNDKIEVFDYLELITDGVEGKAALSLMIKNYEIEENVSSVQEKEELLEFIKKLNIVIEDKPVEIISFDSFDFSADIFEREDEKTESQIFDVKNKDMVVLEILGKQTEYQIETERKEIEILGLGKEVTDISAVTEEMFMSFEADATEYVSLGFSFQTDYREVEAAISNGTAKRYGIFYQIAPFNPHNLDLLETTQTSGLTLSLAYEYKGKIYLVTRTNMYVSYYSFSGNILSFGDSVYFSSFGFTNNENTPEHIRATMSERGYEFLMQ